MNAKLKKNKKVPAKTPKPKSKNAKISNAKKPLKAKAESPQIKRNLGVDFKSLEVPSYLQKLHLMKGDIKLPEQESQAGQVYWLGMDSQTRFEQILRDQAPSWAFEELFKSNKDVLAFSGQEGPVWIIREKKPSRKVAHHHGLLEDSPYAKMRDTVGVWFVGLKSHQLKSIKLNVIGMAGDSLLGALVGVEMGAYQFRAAAAGILADELPQLVWTHFNEKSYGKILKQAQTLGASINLARHLVNLPPNFINPTTLSQNIASYFKTKLNVEIWDANRLQKEGMGLHLAVGQGSQNLPCLVKLSYRPKKKSKLKPLAFVGKGITFDTGGLDIKPSSGMRLMKKDMGGAAAILGIANWVVNQEYARGCDFYLALAENSVDSKSFRPSDVITARNGAVVEIHNTDAEGRLVLADAMDVAITALETPEVLIDVATLTGAIKVALGSELAGLFANHDNLAEAIQEASQQTGDSCWRMPLVPKYNSSMNSAFADFVNAVDGFGGAITAAMFLEKFAGAVPWAHLDIYAWSDRAAGPYATAGGNGQAVQSLTLLLRSFENKNIIRS